MQLSIYLKNRVYFAQDTHRKVKFLNIKKPYIRNDMRLFFIISPTYTHYKALQRKKKASDHYEVQIYSNCFIQYSRPNLSTVLYESVA